MARLTPFIATLAHREDGQALVEYSLILALIALAALTGLVAMSGGVDGMYTVIRTIANAMSDALSG